MRALISYAHEDDTYLSLLHKHLVMLRRDGLISAWFDRKILPGGEIDNEISDQLESCELFLPLVSADFLNSSYCYEAEMTRALARQRAGALRIVPIVIRPCEWLASPLAQFKALPTDGSAVSIWGNKDEAFLNIVEGLRDVLTRQDLEANTEEVRPSSNVRPSAARKYRVKRNFNEIDRRNYRERCFTEICAYFEEWAAELSGLPEIRIQVSSEGPNRFSCIVVNDAQNRRTARISAYARSSSLGFGDIWYSFSRDQFAGSANGIFTIESNEYELYLRPIMTMSMFTGSAQQEQLSPKNVAETMWRELLEQAGIDYD